MRRTLILFIFSGTVFFSFAIVGGRETEVEARPNTPSIAFTDVSIAYVSGSEGVIFPQVHDKLGGLIRCASLLDKLRMTQDALLLNNGNQTEQMEKMESELYISFLDLLQVDALSIGPGDFKVRILIPEIFENETAFINCNIFRHGKRLFPDRVIQHVSSAGIMLKIATIGAVSEKFEPIIKAYVPDLEIRDMKDSLNQTLSQLPSDISLIILLAHVISEDAIIKLAKKLPNIDVILFEAPGLAPFSKPIDVGETIIANSGSGVSHVLLLNIKLQKKGRGIKYYESSLIPVSAEIPDSPDLFELIKGYQNTFILDNDPKLPGDKMWNIAQQEPNTYVGSEVCGKCHEYEYHVWAKSQHAVPLKIEHQNSSGCLGCHSTGFGFKISPVHNIGCEACHGPGKQHSVEPKSRRYNAVPVAVCNTCHTSTQTPGFSYFTYWRQINH